MKKHHVSIVFAVAALTVGCANHQTGAGGEGRGVAGSSVAQGLVEKDGEQWYQTRGQLIPVSESLGGNVFVIGGDTPDKPKEASPVPEVKEKPEPVVTKVPVPSEPAKTVVDAVVQAAIVSPVDIKHGKPSPIQSSAAQKLGLAMGEAERGKSALAPMSIMSLVNKRKECLIKGVPEDMQGAELLARVHFYFNSPDKLYQPSVDRLSEALADVPEGKRVVVLGFSDDQGLDSANRAISILRAKHVQAMVKKTWPGVKVSAEGRGACPRISDEDSSHGRALNRRAEIYAL